MLQKYKLEDLGEFKNGVNFSSDKMGNGFPLVNVKDVTDNFLISDDRLAKVNLDLKPDSDYLAKEGDLFFVRSSVKFQGAGKVGLIRNIKEDTTHCGFIIRYRLTDKNIDPLFLLYLFNAPRGRERLRNLASGATIFNISQKSLKTLEIEAPPLPNQRKIAAILSAYDDLIENNLNRIKLLEEKAFLRYKGIVRSEKLVRKRLKDVLDLKYGKALKADDRNEGKYPVYGSSGKVGSHEDFLIEGPGIIVGRKGNIGSVFWSDESFWPIDTVYYVESELSYYFLYFNLKEQHFVNTDAAVPGLNRNFALDNWIELPPQKAVGEFDTEAIPVFQLMNILRKQNTKLREARDILLPRLMSGDVEV